MGKKKEKQKSYVILTPLPQLKLSNRPKNYTLEPGLSVATLKPRLRRKLSNIAKAKNCSEDLLMLLVHSEAFFCAEIPRPSPWKSPRVDGVYYSSIAEEILKRIFNCLLLVNWIPMPLFSYCWFLAPGVTDSIDLNSLELLQSDREFLDRPENIDWRSSSVEPVNVSPSYTFLTKHWDKLSLLCHIDQLNNIFTDKAKWNGYLKAAYKHRDSMIEQYLEGKYGPGVKVDFGGDTDTTYQTKPKAKPVPNDASEPEIIRIPNRLSCKWTLEGLNKTFWNEIDKLSIDLHKRPSGRRFIRAFQFFTNAFRLPIPHRYVAFTTCLEVLFCKEGSEVTFQLASRIAWFLNPNDSKQRLKTFYSVKKLYDIRSKIVHGAKFSTNKVEQSEEDVVAVLRKIFIKILSINDIYRLAFDKDQKVWNDYLTKLTVGL